MRSICAAALLAACCLAMCAAGVQAQATPCGWNGYDFSSLAEGDMNWQGEAGGIAFFRPCGVITSNQPCVVSGTNVSACGIEQSVAYAWGYNANDTQELQWQFVSAIDPSQGIQQTLLGELCYTGPQPASPTPFQTIVQFSCYDGPSEIMSITPQEGDDCMNTIHIGTQAACGLPASTCAFDQYDFSSVVGQVLQAEYENNTYFLSLCQNLPVGSAACAGSYNSSACMVSSTGQSTNIGSWNDPSTAWDWIWVNNTGVTMFMNAQGPSTCSNTGSELVPWLTEVMFTCSQASQPTLSVFTDSYSCTITLTVATPAACDVPPPPPSPQPIPCSGVIGSSLYDLSALTVLMQNCSIGDTSFLLQLCAVVDNDACDAQAPGSMICEVTGGGVAVAENIGNMPSSNTQLPLFYIDPSNEYLGVVLQSEGANTCKNEGGFDTTYVTNINFVCASTVGQLSAVQTGTCTFNLTLPTSAACPPAKPVAPILPVVPVAPATEAVSSPSSACSFVGYDLSALQYTDLVNTINNEQFSIRVCGVASTQPACQSVGAQACGDVNGEVFALGLQPTTYDFTFITPDDPSNGIQYTLQGEQTCTNQPWMPQGNNWTTIVQISCATDLGELLNVQSDANACQYVFQLGSSILCPKPTATCAVGAYDLTPIAGRVLTSDTGVQGNITFELCGVLEQSMCSGSGSNVSVCLGGANYSTILGDWDDSAEWSVNAIGPLLTMIGSATCYETGSEQPWNVQVQLSCGGAEPELSVSPWEPGSCVRQMQVAHVSACVNAPPLGPQCLGSLNGQNFDFSYLASLNYNATVGNNTAYLALCYPVSSEYPTASCDSTHGLTVSACLIQTTGFAQDLGDEPPNPQEIDLFYIDPSNPQLGVAFQLEGSPNCQEPGGFYINYVTNINLECAPEFGALTVVQTGLCTYNFTLPSPESCPKVAGVSLLTQLQQEQDERLATE